MANKLQPPKERISLILICWTVNISHFFLLYLDCSHIIHVMRTFHVVPGNVKYFANAKYVLTNFEFFW